MSSVTWWVRARRTNPPLIFGNVDAQGEYKMRLSISGAAIASGLLWGCAILLVQLINLADPAYGANLLALLRSVYPWFHSTQEVTRVLVGTVDGLFDGAIAGALFAWFYNMMLELSSNEHIFKSRHS